MWTVVIELLKNSLVRKALLILVAVLLLVFAGEYTYKHVYNKAYTAGVEFQKGKFEDQQKKAKDTLDAEQKKADGDREKLNSDIQLLTKANALLQDKLDKKYTKQTQEVINYAKSDAGSKPCFDSGSDGLRVINESFPDSD